MPGHSAENPQPQYPPLPKADDKRWQQATVREKTQKTTELRSLPRSTLSTPLLTVHSGDVVSIIRDVRHENWVVAKVGYKMGWLDSSHVDFVLTSLFNTKRDPLPQTKPLSPPPKSEEDAEAEGSAESLAKKSPETETKPLSSDWLPENSASVTRPTRPKELKAEQADESVTEGDMPPVTEESINDEDPETGRIPAPDEVPRSSQKPKQGLPDALKSQMKAVGAAVDDDVEVRLTKREVNRIIKYLMGIADTLKGARDRAEKDSRKSI